MTGIHAFMTNAMKSDLRACGFSEQQLAQLTPQEGDEILAVATWLEPDRDQIEIFVEALFRDCDSEGVVSLRSFYQDDANHSFHIMPTSLKGGLKFLIEAVEDEARRAANNPKPVMFTPPVATFKKTADWHAREIDLLEGPTLSLELDENPRAALATLENLLGFATLVVRSGGEWTNPTTGEVEDKIHAHWRLKEPASGKDLGKLKELRRLATTLVGGDPTNIPINHPIRWPGSWHRKGTPRLCEIISTDHLDNEIDLDLALETLKAIAPPPRRTRSPREKTNQARSIGARRLARSSLARTEGFTPCSCRLPRALPHTRSRNLPHVACCARYSITLRPLTPSVCGGAMLNRTSSQTR
jgi:hypothetical protein